ncbi:MAG: hypothetical protein IJ626_02390 [Muribaculaceae bacterium]|nr:hypothetical protein [Muribaculaceae bacterium]
MENTTSFSPAIVVTVDMGRVLSDVCATSAHLFASGQTQYRLSADNERLIAVKLREGFDDLMRRIAGYVTSAAFGTETATITLRLPQHLGRSHIAAQTGNPATAISLVAAAVEQTLTQYALMCFHDPRTGPARVEGTYRAAWLQARSRTLILLSSL